jgi:hypothetical protein
MHLRLLRSDGMARDGKRGELVVQVYFNRTRKLWSIRRGGKLVARVEALCLEDCRMHVSEIARLKVLVTGKRTVHAWISGRIVSDISDRTDMSELSYDPFTSRYFHNRAGEAVERAALVAFLPTGGCFFRE